MWCSSTPASLILDSLSTCVQLSRNFPSAVIHTDNNRPDTECNRTVLSSWDFYCFNHFIPQIIFFFFFRTIRRLRVFGRKWTVTERLWVTDASVTKECSVASRAVEYILKSRAWPVTSVGHTDSRYFPANTAIEKFHFPSNGQTP